MVYLEKFVLPDEDEEARLANARREENGGALGYLENGYPCMLFPQRGLRELDFEAITIFYGGNGSGKSTLLNAIAERLRLARISPFNGGELFMPYVRSCTYRFGFDEEGEPLSLPSGSRIITSDDVFEYMLAARTRNEEIAEATDEGKQEYARLKFEDTIRFSGMQDYETVRMQLMARQKSLSRRKFLHKTIGKEVRLHSNGETALQFFEDSMKGEAIYCLDEPENSLSPRLQLQMKELLEYNVRHEGCQLIIATHSPFLLALRGAKIYDLDNVPVYPRKWWELENTRTYFEFFEENRRLFLDSDSKKK